jgi:hypothetical protein
MFEDGLVRVRVRVNCLLARSPQMSVRILRSWDLDFAPNCTYIAFGERRKGCS